MEWRQLVTTRPRLCGQTLFSANSRRRARVGYFCLASVSVVVVGAMYSLLKQSFFRLSDLKYKLYFRRQSIPRCIVFYTRPPSSGRAGGRINDWKMDAWTDDVLCVNQDVNQRICETLIILGIHYSRVL